MTEAPPKEEKKGLAMRMAGKTVDAVLDRVIGSLDEKDRKAAAKRVKKMRGKNPEATPEELAALLIKRKCKRTAAVGAITAMPATIPGLGTITAMVFGSAVDLAITAGMQAELVLEIALCFNVTMSPAEERTAILMTTGVSSGAKQVMKKAGQKIAEKASEQLAKKSIARALPVIGMGAAAGVNMAITYTIGRRAIGYFQLGPDRMEDWAETARALTGVDEREMVNWLSEAGESSRKLVGDGLSSARDKVITVAKSSGELVVDSVSTAGDWIKRAGNAAMGLFQRDDATDETLEGEPPPLPIEADDAKDTEST